MLNPISVEGQTFELGGEGAFGGPGIGCDLIASPFFVGLFTRYDFAHISGSSVEFGSFTIDRSIDLGGRVGWNFTKQTALYVDGGWSWAHMDGTIASTSFDAPFVGAGIEHQFTPQWGMKVEYDFHPYSSQSLIGPLKADGPDVHMVRVGLTFTFAGADPALTRGPIFDDWRPAPQEPLPPRSLK